MEKYSKVYLVEGEEHFGYRYNYEYGVLEYVSKWDYEFDEDEYLVDIILPDWQVTASIGLSRENWDENPEHWVTVYAEEIAAEARAELAFEFGDIPYTPSSTAGDYSPSSPWNAPGMSVKDFI